MAKTIEIRDHGEVIGTVREGGVWIDAAGKSSTDILLAGKSYDQIERLFYKRSQHLEPSQSTGQTFHDSYSFHFSE